MLFLSLSLMSTLVPPETLNPKPSTPNPKPETLVETLKGTLKGTSKVPRRVYLMVFVTSTLLGDSPFWAIAKTSSLEERNAASKEMHRD